MSSTSELIGALKSALRARGLRYRDVAAELGLSEASVKRLFAEETFSLHRFNQICALVDVSLVDLARIAAERDPISTLSVDQEAALAADPLLFTVFYLLLNEWRPARIARTYGLTRPRAIKTLTTLDRLGLIELLPGNRVRLLTARSIRWRRDGPVRRAYEERALSEFMTHAFDGPDDSLIMETGELSPASLKLLERRLARLHREFNELVEVDLSLPPEHKRSVGLAIALRPWVFSLMEAQRSDR
jgi:DNA-binding Xre family transcriptional regulator